MDVSINTRFNAIYLIIEGTGSIDSANDEKAFASRCYEEIQKHESKRVLIDQRHITFNSSIVDQCEVVWHYIREFDPMIRKVRIAILVSPKDKDLHAFWELYASNCGYRWKVFTEMEAVNSFLLAA